MDYYAIPISLGKVITGKHIDDEVDIRESIHQNINLMLKSFFLSYRFDPTFGCVMNKYQASTPPQNVSERVWREKMRNDIQQNLKDMLSRYETRVDVRDVFINMVRGRGKRNATVNVQVQVSGNLTLGRREKFHYPDSEVSPDAQEVFPLNIPVGKMK